MYYLVLFTIKILSHIPFQVLYVLSDVLYYPFYYIVRYRRKVVRRNLVESFADKNKKEIVQIEKKFYHFFLDTIFETCKLCTISPEELKRRAVFKNAEVLDGVLERGQSISLYLGHYGNWEWISSMKLWLSAKVKMVQIYHKIKPNYLERIMLQIRERFGHKCVLRNETVRYICKESTHNTPLVVGFVSDQSPKRRESKYFIPFLNHMVPVITGTEKLIKHFNFSAFYITTRRIRRGYFEYEFLPMCEEPNMLPDFELTRLFFEKLEKDIISQPELYLWSHNRFKYAKKSENS